MENKAIRPFVQWAGGKRQLLGQLSQLLPVSVKQYKFNYIEPFVGGGAMLFWLMNTYPPEDFIINDLNEDLILTYKVIQNQPLDLINILEIYESEFNLMSKEDLNRKNYFLAKREIYNRRSEEDPVRAALFIFLNKTCYNGLYRVNTKNQFNVSIDLDGLPVICNTENIIGVNSVLQKGSILCGDYELCVSRADENCFLFIDPPYKPLHKTSNFTSYTKNRFDDDEQIRLRDFCIKLHEKGCKWMLCNSDPGNGFFEQLYSGFKIHRVFARRNINCKGNSRGKVTELVITNY